MIMPAGQERLLLPLKPRYLWLTLLCAMVLHMVLVLAGGRTHLWLPDVLLIAVLFWVVHQERFIGMGTAFLCGLLVDVYSYGLLGHHALVYVAAAAAAILLRRRLRQFNVWEQMLQIAPVFAAATLLDVLVGVISGGLWPSLSILLKPLVETLLWPLAAWILQAPQRRAPDPDLHRPL